VVEISISDNNTTERYSQANVSPKSQQLQTVINLFESGIPPEIIGLQLDMELDDVNSIIQNIYPTTDTENLHNHDHDISGNPRPLMNISPNHPVPVIHLDALVDIPQLISISQSDMWKALRSNPVFTFPFEETQEFLGQYSGSKIKLIILHIDIVGSTKLSMTLPIERLSKIIQTFTQEMTRIIKLYGGFVLKYIGDAIIGFFIVNTDNLYLPCINTINCARTMIKVINQGFNPVLNQFDYPEMGVRIGIDYGENVIVSYMPPSITPPTTIPPTNSSSLFSSFGDDDFSGGDGDGDGGGDGINNLNLQDGGSDTVIPMQNKSSKSNISQPLYDILGYTISVATKMTAYAKSNHIIVGQLVYDILSKEEQSYFAVVDTQPDNWSYISDETGSIYKLYINRT
jgi:adenylate cyclase